MKYLTRYEFFQNGENLRMTEMYSNSEDFLKQMNEVVFPHVSEIMEDIEITSVSIYGSVSDEVKQTIADFGPTYYEMISKVDL